MNELLLAFNVVLIFTMKSAKRDAKEIRKFRFKKTAKKNSQMNKRRNDVEYLNDVKNINENRTSHMNSHRCRRYTNLEPFFFRLFLLFLVFHRILMVFSCFTLQFFFFALTSSITAPNKTCTLCVRIHAQICRSFMYSEQIRWKITIVNQIKIPTRMRRTRFGCTNI